MIGTSGLMNPAKWLIDYVTGGSSGDGKNVTSKQALSYAPVWYGVNKIAGHLGQLPIGVYRRLERGAERDRTHQVARVLRRPNPYQTSIVFREQIATHSLLEGNGRAAIVRSGSRIQELIPLDPDCTVTGMLNGIKLHASRPSRDDRLRNFFETTSSDPNDTEGVIMLDDADVLHIPGLSMDGVCGVPLRTIAKRNLNASINTDKRINNQMEKGFTGSLMLQAPAGMFRQQKDAEDFLDHFEKRHNSPEKAGKTGMLREGMTANILQSTNRDTEMIENRKFQRQDAALWLGLEQILGDDSSVSYNSLEQKNLAYLMNTLNKWLKRWEEELEVKLFTAREFDSDAIFIRFNTAALLKSDYKTSVESLAMAIGSTILSPNEAREKLDLNPYEGGDTYANPAITPGETDTPEESEGTDDSEGTETQNLLPGLPGPNQAALAVQARVQHMIGVEANRVTEGTKQKNFLAWLDNFYSAKWEPKLADVFEEIGLDRELATAHCAESLQRLLAVADYSQPENLTENVEKCVLNWKQRANQIGVIENV